MTDGASNHSTTYNRLKGNGLTTADFFEKRPKTAEWSVESIKRILDIDIHDDYAVTSTNVKKALREAYANEDAFDKALFSALKTDLIKMGVEFTDLEGQTNENIMLIKTKTLTFEDASYAFGFARQARRETNKPHSLNDDISPAVNVTGAERSGCDHSCCVFKKSKGGNEWIIEAMFSVVELKMSDKSSKCGKNLLQNDPIVQAICYVIEHVWPEICKLGLVKTETRSLPIALIAAEKKEKKLNKKFKRFVKGSLLLPLTWGDPFQVQSNFFQPFDLCQQPMENIMESPEETKDAISSQSDGNGEGVRMEVDEDDDNDDRMNIDDKGEHNEAKNEADGDQDDATNLYMETILEGIRLLQQCYDTIKDRGGKLPFPSPLSGFPPEDAVKEENGHDYCGSPVLSVKDLEQFQQATKPKYCISQGDLHFFESLDLSTFSDDNSWGVDYSRATWLVEDSTVKNVFVKVWSRTVHRAVQDVNVYIKAYTWIISKRSSLKGSLSEVLIGAVDMGTAALTITRKIEGSAVKPKTLNNKEDYKSELKIYWELFSGLCTDVLLPLANIGIVHQDLRPGHDCTYNVMIEIKKTETDTTRKMRLIDYESLCLVHDYIRPTVRHGEDCYDDRYPSKSDHKEQWFLAYEFLFQQCVGIVYAWIKEIPAKEMNFTKAMHWFWEKLGPKLAPAEKNGKGDANEWWFLLIKKKGPEIAFDELFGYIGDMFAEDHGTTTSQRKTEVGKDADSAKTAATVSTAATIASSKHPPHTPQKPHL